MSEHIEFIRGLNGENCVLFIKGRLDAAGAVSFDKEIEDILYCGGRKISAEMSAVAYMSSAGLRSLIKTYKDFKKFGGSLSISNPSPSVMSVLKLSRLDAILVQSGAQSNAEMPQQSSSGWEAMSSQIPELNCEIRRFHSVPDAQPVLRGSPEKLSSLGFGASDAELFSLEDDESAVGIAAFGSGFEDCKSRFGEFMAVCGSAACLPSDDTKYPDFMTKGEKIMPQANVLYSIGFRGRPSSCIRFETASEKRSIEISKILSAALASSGAKTAGIVMLAESSGLVAASMKKAPFSNSSSDFFSESEVRQRLDFSHERIFERNVVLVCGLLSKSPEGRISDFLRPMNVASEETTPLFGHLHACVFSFQALPRREIVLEEELRKLFDEREMISLLHLLSDNREIVGAGESLLSEGAVWIWKIAEAPPGGKA